MGAVKISRFISCKTKNCWLLLKTATARDYRSDKFSSEAAWWRDCHYAETDYRSSPKRTGELSLQPHWIILFWLRACCSSLPRVKFTILHSKENMGWTRLPLFIICRVINKLAIEWIGVNKYFRLDKIHLFT